MAKSVATVSIDIVAEQAKLKAELDKVKKELGVLSGAAKKTERAFSVAGKALAGAFSVAALAGFTRAVIRETAAQEQAQAQLTAALRSTQGVVGLTAEQLNTMAAELQRTTTFADDAVTAMQSVLLTFTKIRGQEFKDATAAVLDMSVRLGTDLTSAAVQVGKALNDPIKGVTALGRAGVQFSEDQKALIKSLVETGRTAEAQRVILKELEVQFGGSAVAARNTLGGAIAALNNSFGDLLEANSGAPAVTAAINKLTDALNDPRTKQGFDSFIGGLAGLGAGAIEAAAGIGELIAKADNLFQQDILDDLAHFEKVLAEGPSLLDRIFGFDEEGAKEQIKLIQETLRTALPDGVTLKGQIAGGGSGPQNSRRNALPDVAPPEVLGPTPEQLAEAELMWQQAVTIRNDATRLLLSPVPGAGIGGAGEDLAIRGLIVGPVQDMKIEIESLPETWQTALERMAEASGEFSSFLASNAEVQIAIEQAKNQTIGSLFADALTVAAGGSSKFAKLQQKIALAQAIWYTASGITNALRSVPFPANIAAAAKVALAGGIQIAKIKATSVGTEGGGFSAGLSASNVDGAASQTVPGVQQQEIREQATVVVHGNIFSSRETADWFIEQISDAVNNRDVTIIGTGSRQAAELMPA